MLTLNPQELQVAEVQNYLQAAIAPRPICFASTIDRKGRVNLSPFSFFNLFSADPPVCVFSPSRRVRDNTNKHTLENIIEVPECVINIVSYSMVQQTNLASTEYPKGVNEFVKAGFTQLKSELVKPPRVGESPVQLECVVNQVIPLGEKPGSGNLVLAEVKLIHIREEILNEEGKIDQEKIDLVARLGGNWYCHITGESLFKVAKPIATKGIGVDQLPFSIRNSKVLTGNHLGQLGNVESLPDRREVEVYYRENPEIGDMLNMLDDREEYLHKRAASLLDKGLVSEAWKLLLLPDILPA